MSNQGKPRARVHGQDENAPGAFQPDTPSQTMVKGAAQTGEKVDSRGRCIIVRRLTSLDRMRLFAAAGPELSKNENWIGLAALAASCVGIDGEQVPKPASRMQIEALVDRLDDDGMEAIAAVYQETFGVTATEDVAATAKN